MGHVAASELSRARRRGLEPRDTWQLVTAHGSAWMHALLVVLAWILYAEVLSLQGVDIVNKRYFHLWHNHGGRLNMHIITGHVLCRFLISLNGLIPSVLSPNLIFLESLEKSSSWARPNCFHCCHPQGVESFHLSYDSHPKQQLRILGFENICFKRSIISRYHITRKETFLYLEPSMFQSRVTFFLFHPRLFLLFFIGIILNLLTVIILFLPTSIAPWAPIFEFVFFLL
jgi:hypothetical protein